MSFSIEFHFGQIELDYPTALREVDRVLQTAGFRFSPVFYEMEFNDDHSILDTRFPARRAARFAEAASADQGWVGRGHSYDSRFTVSSGEGPGAGLIDTDLGVYGWTAPPAGLVLTIDYRQWERLRVTADVEDLFGMMCSVAQAIGSPFGLTRVNTDSWTPLSASELDNALLAVRSAGAEPEVLWVDEERIPFKRLQSDAGIKRDTIRFPHFSVAYVRSFITGAHSEKKTAGAP